MSEGVYGSCPGRWCKYEMRLSYAPSTVAQLLHPTFSWGYEHAGSFFGCVQAHLPEHGPFLAYLHHNASPTDGGKPVPSETPLPPHGTKRIVILVLEHEHFGVADVDVSEHSITVHDWLGLGCSGWGFKSYFQYLLQARLCQNQNEFVAKWNFSYRNLAIGMDCRQQVCGPLSCLALGSLALGWSYNNDYDVRITAVQRLISLLRGTRPHFQVNAEVLRASNCLSFWESGRWNIGDYQTCRDCNITNEMMVIVDCHKGCSRCVSCMRRPIGTWNSSPLKCPICTSDVAGVALFNPGNGSMRAWDPSESLEISAA